MQNFNNLGQGGGPQSTIVNDNATVRDDQQVVNSSAQLQDSEVAVPESVVATGSVETGAPTQVANPALTQMVDSFSPENIMTDAAADMAREQALLLQSRDIATAEQNAIASRANIEKNANLGQRQAILGEYTKEQTIEKMGWTGGYRTDADVQMSYLQASIGADLYGQMELQRLGYETALEQARLNFSLNNMQLANEYMNQQWQIEFQRANLTGELISPIDRENVNQFKAAQTILNAEDGVYSAEQKAKAQLVYQQMLEWYGGEGLGEQGLDALYRIANLNRNEQQFEMNQMQLDQIELNMEMSIQAAAREIRADGEVAIVEYKEDGSVKSVYGINPTSTQTEDIAKLQTYYGENQEDFIRLIQDYERFQVNQYLAAQESGRFTGSYTQYLSEMGQDVAMELYERYADSANYQDGFIDPFDGQYRTPNEPTYDNDGNLITTPSIDDIINNSSLSITERNNTASDWFKNNSIDSTLYSGTNPRSQYLSYKKVEDFIKNGSASEISINDLYKSLSPTILKNQGGADDKDVAARLNTFAMTILGSEIEFGFSARQALAGGIIASNNGLILVDKNGNDLSEADFNALPSAQQQLLKQIGFGFYSGRNRYLLLYEDGRPYTSGSIKDNKAYGEYINTNLFSGGIDKLEGGEEAIFRNVIYNLMVYNSTNTSTSQGVVTNAVTTGSSNNTTKEGSPGGASPLDIEGIN